MLILSIAAKQERFFSEKNDFTAELFNMAIAFSGNEEEEGAKINNK